MPREIKNELSYESAFAELQQIVREMEEGEIGVDDLSNKVKRAAMLIRICKTKLATTEEDVKGILNELEEKSETENG
jgi:exodeoxyribonuclease VII small subunit